MKIKTLLLLAIPGVLLYFAYPQSANHQLEEYRYKTALISIRSASFTAKIADTPSKRNLGLSFSSPLLPDEAMLFVFEEPGVNGFWMKNMNYPIDILWIDDRLRVVDAVEKVLPETYPDVFTPNTPTQLTLEIPSGSMEQNGIRIGDQVQIILTD